MLSSCLSHCIVYSDFVGYLSLIFRWSSNISTCCPHCEPSVSNYFLISFPPPSLPVFLQSMDFNFVDFFAVVGLGPAPIDPPAPAPPDPSDVPDAMKIAHSTSVIRRRKNSVSRGVQCVATAHFYQGDQCACTDDAPGFSELFGAPLPPAMLDSYPLSKDRDQIADALPQFCFPTGLYLSRSGALPTYFRIVLTDVQGARM